MEDDRNDDRDKQLEETLDPEVDDPEAPGIGDGVVGRSIKKQSRQVEYEIAAAAIKKKLMRLRRSGSRQADATARHSNRNQKTRPMEPEPGAAQPLKEPGPLAKQTPCND